MKEKPAHLIEKFLEGKLSPEEAIELREWMNTPGGRLYLEREIQLHHLTRASLLRFDAGKAYAKKLPELRKAGTKRVTLPGFYRYAAALLILLGCAYLFYITVYSNTEQLVIPDEKITLQLEDGTVRDIVPDGEQLITGKNGEAVTTRRGDTLYYHAGTPPKRPVYNMLTVPYGKTFKLRLSDATVVHLNAGSKLRFPVQFGRSSREVFLEGEACFTVKANTEAPFLVHTERMDVEVTGTRFNISAYGDDPETTVALAEGAVTVHGSGDVRETGVTEALVPGQVGILNKQTTHIIKKNTDVKDYMAWMDNKVVLDNKTFGEVLKVLERKYNVTIQNNYPALDEERFKATFDSETIAQVLRTFTESRLFSYRIRNNVIIIDKPEE